VWDANPKGSQSSRVGAGTKESAHAHKTSNAKDAFVAHRIKGSYDQRAVDHEGGRLEAQKSGILGFESTHTRVGTQKILDFGSLDQSLLDSTVSNVKFFAFRPRSFAFRRS
jgi:hypothetical protein